MIELHTHVKTCANPHARRTDGSHHSCSLHKQNQHIARQDSESDEAMDGIAPQIWPSLFRSVPLPVDVLWEGSIPKSRDDPQEPSQKYRGYRSSQQLFPTRLLQNSSCDCTLRSPSPWSSSGRIGYPFPLTQVSSRMRLSSTPVFFL